MDRIIREARKQYPNNQTQQFYRVIKPFLEEVFAKSSEDSLSVDKFEDGSTGIHVMRQFFEHNSMRYCFWICLFPLLTPDGKKNAFYGIERRNNDKWQSIWSEVPDNKLSLLFRLRVITKMDSDEILYIMSPFEDALKNALANSDIYEQRKIITKIIMNYINAGNEYRMQKEKVIGNKKFSYTIFKLFGILYIWIDLYVDNLLESFRLDAVYDESTSFVLFSSKPNDDPQIGAMAIMKLLTMDELS